MSNACSEYLNISSMCNFLESFTRNFLYKHAAEPCINWVKQRKWYNIVILSFCFTQAKLQTLAFLKFYLNITIIGFVNWGKFTNKILLGLGSSQKWEKAKLPHSKAATLNNLIVLVSNALKGRLRIAYLRGRCNEKQHLLEMVLIALASTSNMNFLASRLSVSTAAWMK